jgi:hypothetical protein
MSDFICDVFNAYGIHSPNCLNQISPVDTLMENLISFLSGMLITMGVILIVPIFILQVFLMINAFNHERKNPFKRILFYLESNYKIIAYLIPIISNIVMQILTILVGAGTTILRAILPTSALTFLGL